MFKNAFVTNHDHNQEINIKAISPSLFSAMKAQLVHVELPDTFSKDVLKGNVRANTLISTPFGRKIAPAYQDKLRSNISSEQGRVLH